MKFNIPAKLPSKGDFAKYMFECILGETNVDLFEKQFTILVKSFEEKYAKYKHFKEKSIVIENFLKYINELCPYVEQFFGDTESSTHTEIASCLSSFSNDTHQLKQWINATKDTGRGFSKAKEPSLCLSYLLFASKSPLEKKIEFFKYCLETLGVTDLTEAEEKLLFAFNWDDVRENSNELKCKGIIACGFTMAVLFRSVGQAPKDNIITNLHNFIKELFASEINTFNSVVYAQKALFDCVKYFEPRSITRTDILYPENYYIPSDFTNKNSAPAVPTSDFDGKKSRRSLIVAKTGYGKTAYMQMLTMAILANSLDENEFNEQDKARLDDIKKLGEKLCAPKDKVIISIPAKMFYEHFGRHSSVDNCDFVELFFHCMWNLHGKYNFYSKDWENPIVKADDSFKNFVYDEAFKSYIDSLARDGKLVLLLDSFDEITQGDMRAKYLSSICKFYDKYCRYTEAEAIGAHIIMTSREMSPETMEQISVSLVANTEDRHFQIKPLSDEGKYEIIKRWRNSNSEADEMMAHIKKNHFYEDYSVNPYMLSVVCEYIGEKLGTITKRLIDTLVRRMKENNRNAEIEIQGVFSHITDILQDVAVETVIANNAHFSKALLGSKIKSQLDTSEITIEQAEEFLETLHSIFITEVGLIVPADGEDGAYQFINDQIRFELASDGFKKYLADNINAYKVFADRITSAHSYIGFLIPLLCSLNIKELQISVELIKELALKDYSTQEENEQLIVAMLDLVLSRYGSNVATTLKPGDRDKDAVFYVQKLLMTRILSSSAFKPTSDEKEAILNCAAYINCEQWLHDNVKKTLSE